MSVNESLVARLSGKSVSSKAVSPKLAATTKKKKSPAPSQQKAQASNRVAESTKTPAFDDVQNLHGMHKMYVKIAESIMDTKSLNSTRKIPTPASEGDVIGSQGKSSTLLKSRKIQLKGSQNDDRSVLNSSYDVQIPSVLFENRHPSLNDEFMVNEGNSLANISSYGRGLKSYQNSDIEDVILSLEEEFSTLNDQYRSLLSSAQALSPSSAEIKQGDDLVAVIQKLHRKGEQLRALKSPPRG